MKKLITMSILSLFVATLSAQEKADTLYITLSQGRVVKYAVSEVLSMEFTPVAVPEFPAADKSKVLSVNYPAEAVHDILNEIGTACTDTLGRVNITEAQYQEIKTFTDELVNGLNTQKSIYDKCFKWVCDNVKYGQSDNEPYPVFINKKGVCQGYANLLFVMLHTQGVPAMVVNGYLQPYGGHAWNYVNCDGTWYVSDPTNRGQHKMSDLSNYKSTLVPTSMDVVVAKENGCWYDFNEGRMNICKVATNKSFFVAPYSVNGFKLISFNPTYDIPENVKELYLGENIEYIGQNSIGLKKYAPNLEYIHVDAKNKTYRSHAGVLYYTYSDEPQCIPMGMKRIELLPLEKIEKNTVYNHDGVEELVIAEGTKNLEAWAVENCPNLKVAYIPESTEVDVNAFFKVHNDFKIVRVK